MGNKRKREISPVAAKAPNKKQRRKQAKKQAKLEKSQVSKSNNFQPLFLDDSEDREDESLSGNDDFVLVDSDSHDENEYENENDDEVVIVSDSEDNHDEEKRPESEKGENEYNELSKNQDFIEFGFSSSEGEDERILVEDGEYSDDGIISDDQEGILHTKMDNASLYPWIKDHDHSKQKEIADWLTHEMKDFVNYISPSKEEIITRNLVVSTLKKEISNFWPGTEAHVFGSCATDLYLPGSDIDMVIISKTGDYENRSRLYQLSSFLRTHNLAKNIEVIAKAKVPIIKFVDPSSNIHIDVSFERSNGIMAAKKIRKWLATTPGLRELVLIVKQFLRSRKLNNVHVGGLGGYSTIMLCYHFLKLHPRLSTSSIKVLDNLGSLLIEFFELYGRNFSYDDLIIAIDTETDLPKYLLKRHHPVLNTSRNPFSIVIQDPSDPANNISRSSYNLRDLKKAFGGAYQLLVDKCYQLNGASYKQRIGQSILGDIIRYKGKERDFNDDRDKVINNALITHDDESQDESDGANGNDKYYFSDITVESENEGVKEEKLKKQSPNPEKKAPSKKIGSKPNGFSNKDQSQKRVSDYMSIRDSDSEASDNDNKNDIKDQESKSSKKPKLSLDKDVRRDYWKQKGLDI